MGQDSRNYCYVQCVVIMQFCEPHSRASVGYHIKFIASLICCCSLQRNYQCDANMIL